MGSKKPASTGTAAKEPELQIISLGRAEELQGWEGKGGPGGPRGWGLSLLSPNIAGVRPTLLSELVLPELYTAGAEAQLFCFPLSPAPNGLPTGTWNWCVKLYHFWN